MSGRQVPIAQMIAPHRPPPPNLAQRKSWMSREEETFLDRAEPFTRNLKNSPAELLKLAEYALEAASNLASELARQRDHAYGSPERLLTEAWRYQQNCKGSQTMHFAAAQLLLAFMAKLMTDLDPAHHLSMAKVLADMHQQYLNPSHP